MKYAILLLLASNSMLAMQQPNCFYAYHKFLAMLSSCEQRTSWYGIDPIQQRQECIEILFNKFRQECMQEEQEKKN